VKEELEDLIEEAEDLVDTGIEAAKKGRSKFAELCFKEALKIYHSKGGI
jgi:hypothetical protein